MSWLQLVTCRRAFEDERACLQALDGGRRWIQWHEQFLSQQRSLMKVSP